MPSVYGAGRMMYGLAKQGLAPKSFGKVAKNGAPWMTTLLMIVVMAVGGDREYRVRECF